MSKKIPLFSATMLFSVAILFVFLAVLGFSSKHPSRAMAAVEPSLPNSWRYETISERAYQGAALALDSNGNPHIAYQVENGLEHKLYHTHWNGTVWVSETITTLDWYAGGTEIVLNSQDHPYIINRSCHIYACLFAALEWTGSKWITSTLFPSDNGVTDTVAYSGSQYAPAGSIALQFDPSGKLHAAYSAGNVLNRINLNYAIRVNGIWTVTVVERGLPVVGPISLALDQNHQPHILYNDAANSEAGYLRYAFLSTTTWITQVLESNTGNANSLIISNNIPNMSYYDQKNGDLRYRSLVNGQWLSQTVDSVGDVGNFTKIQVDSQGRPRIAYYDATNRALKYAMWDGTRWQIGFIDIVSHDNLVFAGGPISFLLDKNDLPTISYFKVRSSGKGLTIARGDLSVPTDLEESAEPAQPRQFFLPLIEKSF